MSNGNTIAAIIVEPMQGATGVIAPPLWLNTIRKICDQHGIVFIADEIQSGLGRTGKMFACQHWEVSPDIMVLGKGISGGVGSLGAVIARKDIADAFEGATTPTSAGNAVSCAAGLA